MYWACNGGAALKAFLFPSSLSEQVAFFQRVFSPPTSHQWSFGIWFKYAHKHGFTSPLVHRASAVPSRLWFVYLQLLVQILRNGVKAFATAVRPKAGENESQRLVAGFGNSGPHPARFRQRSRSATGSLQKRISEKKKGYMLPKTSERERGERRRRHISGVSGSSFLTMRVATEATPPPPPAPKRSGRTLGER